MSKALGPEESTALSSARALAEAAAAGVDGAVPGPGLAANGGGTVGDAFLDERLFMQVLSLTTAFDHYL